MVNVGDDACLLIEMIAVLKGLAVLSYQSVLQSFFIPKDGSILHSTSLSFIVGDFLSDNI